MILVEAREEYFWIQQNWDILVFLRCADKHLTIYMQALPAKPLVILDICVFLQIVTGKQISTWQKYYHNLGI